MYPPSAIFTTLAEKNDEVDGEEEPHEQPDALPQGPAPAGGDGEEEDRGDGHGAGDGDAVGRGELRVDSRKPTTRARQATMRMRLTSGM